MVWKEGETVRLGGETMEYITVREAAQKWGISVRLVQRHCAAGRVGGVQKFGGTWAIPAGAPKPQDPRRKGGKAAQACPPPSGRQACGTSALLMPLLNTAFVPGSCLRSIEAMQEGPQRELALAEYHYFRGEAQQAVQNVEDGYRMIHTAESGLRQAEENLRVMRNRYAAAMSPLTDLLDAQSQWQQAQSNLIEAQTQYMIYRTDYLRATGQLE